MAESSRTLKQSIADEGSKRQECSLLSMSDEMFAATICKNNTFHDKENTSKNFGELLSFYIKEAGMDSIDMELASGISERTIRKMMKMPDYDPAVETIICISITLNLNLSLEWWRLISLFFVRKNT